MESVAGWLSWAVALACVATLVGAVLALRRLARRLEQALRPRAAPAAPAVPQPTAAASAEWLYLRPGEPPKGPVGLTVLRAMVADGRLAADVLAAPAGSNDWRPLARLLVEEGA